MSIRKFKYFFLDLLLKNSCTSRFILLYIKSIQLKLLLYYFKNRKTPFKSTTPKRSIVQKTFNTEEQTIFFIFLLFKKPFNKRTYICKPFVLNLNFEMDTILKTYLAIVKLL